MITDTPESFGQLLAVIGVILVLLLAMAATYLFTKRNLMFRAQTQVKAAERECAQRLAAQNDLLTVRTLALLHICELVPYLIYTKDSDGLYTGCNTAFAALAGGSIEDLTGRLDAEIFCKDLRMATEMYETDQRVMRSKRPHIVTFDAVYPDGTRARFEALRRPLVDGTKTVGMVGLLRRLSPEEKKTC